MRKDQILGIIEKNSLPISRGNDSVIRFLEKHYGEYMKSLDNASIRMDDDFLGEEFYSELRKNIPKLQEKCDQTIAILKLFNNGKLFQAQAKFNEYMTDMTQYLQKSEKGFYRELDKPYYRIRSSDGDSLERNELFHIPMDKRNLIQSFRYSIAGYPCLYLATDESLCWFECGMPKSFFISGFPYTKRLQLFNLARPVQDIVYIIERDYYEHKEILSQMCIGTLFLYILKSACSIIANDKSSKFIEEYIFPQLLLFWIRDNGRYDGIAYHTSSPYKSAPNPNSSSAYNNSSPKCRC